ncbi:MAG: right-handed parallel beta-helix repeat-containing protein [Duncaniella sp.]|nr:right-handed parallel beta-helix repeat-containing protein [Duncaniella sp.]
MKTSRLLAAMLLAGASVCASAKDFVITDYGVSTDSTAIQSAAIQAVIDRAEAEGGGRIVVPEGTFLTGALFFKPGTSLYLEKGAVIKGIDDIAHYPLIPSRMEGRSIYYHAALINAYFVDNFSISGSGIINGNAAKFWDEFWALREERRKIGKSCTNLEVRRPRLVFMWGCDSLTISGVQLRNSAFWTTHLYQCHNVLIENATIYAPTKPVKAPSSDAIDLDVCSNVTVRGCFIDCNDDAVCIKGGKGVYANVSPENGIVENVLVENCHFGPNCHGTLTMGSECIHARNITLRDCTVDTHTSILRLKMRPDTYQIYENITISGVKGTCGSVIDMKPWKQFFTLEGSSLKPYGIVRNILIENVDATIDNVGTIAGNPDDTVSNFALKNITLKSAPDKTPEFVCNYPTVVLDNVTLDGKKVTNPAK